jgi:hypothetical protein
MEAVPICKGSCYLKKQLKQNQEKQNTLEINKKEIILFYQSGYVSDIHPDYGMYTIKKRFDLLDLEVDPQNFFPRIFRPPIIIA